MLTCGPSIKETWNDEVAAYLADKLVIAVKQTYDLAPEIVDFQLLNSWNFQPYDYLEPRPIVLMERADDDPPTPGLQADMLFRIPDPRNFSQRLATTLRFEDWLFTKTLDRPWGPGVVYELGIYLMVHLGVSEIVTMGWDLGELNSPTMEHFFPEEAPESPKSDDILNKPRIRTFEVGDIADSTRALYYWLRGRGIHLSVISDRSLVDPVVPRITHPRDSQSLAHYRTDLLANGDFLQWVNGTPRFWDALPQPHLVRHRELEDRSKVVVELQPGDGTATTLNQMFRIEEFFQGGRLSARADALCHEPGKLGWVVAFFRDAKDRDPIIVRQDHPGDGHWHTLEIDTRVPTDTLIRYFKFTLNLRAQARQPAFVDSVCARLSK